MDNLKKGILFTTILSLVIIVFFFREVLKNPNNTYFSSGGDGFKSYYGAIYHLQYDSTYLKFNGMNYPYGESVFFTDNLPLLTNTVKWISNNIFDIRQNIVGIINLSMIFSLLLAALFLSLLFCELEVPWWFASLASLGICMLSPQVGRMAGHFSLSHLFWIPLMLYLVVRFSRKPSWLLTLLIAFVGLWAALMQLYFIGFYGLLLTFFWLQFKNWYSESWNSRIYALLHWFIQTCVPFIILELIMIWSDPVSDRTTHPYGFLVYLAHPVSVFLPSGSPYGFVSKYITVFSHLDWEAYAFIGVVASLGFMAGAVLFFKNMFTGKAFWKISNKPVLTAFFWAAFVALLLSFGLPFKMDMEWLTDYIGPFRQLRALSRFSWLFFYVINVLVFYQLYFWFSVRKKKILPSLLVFTAFSLLFVDGYYNMNGTASRLINRNSLVEDANNKQPDDQWVNQIDVAKFQAIIPIPYFHVGSENIWIEPKNNSLENTLIASLKTGLPTTAVMMGRTSIGQTYRNYALMLDPLHEFPILSDFKNKKDIILLLMKGYQTNKDEKRLKNNAQFLTENSQFEVFCLPFDSLRRIPGKYRQEVLADFDPEKLIKKEGIFLNDTSSFFYYQGYESEKVPAFFGTGAHSLRAVEWNTLFEQKLLKAKKGEDYFVSFWLKDFEHDAYPRFNIEIDQLSGDGKILDYFYSDIHRYLKAIDSEWALFEMPVNVKENDVLLKISIRNNVLRRANYVMDELLIRSADNNSYQIKNNYLVKNTRKFKIN